jgi:hypothetical protein
MARRMKIHAHIEQGSADWFKLRLGIPTASCFDLIVTPKKCDLQVRAEALRRTAAEHADGQR